MNAPAHTSWGPSSSARRILCPGSLAAEADAPNDDSSYAVIGSGAHALAEIVLDQSILSDVILDPHDWIGEEVFVPKSDGLDEPVEFKNNMQIRTADCVENENHELESPGYLVTVDYEMAGYIEEYVTYVNAFRMDKDFAGLFYAERSYALDRWLPGNKGTADTIALVGRTLHVVDLKYGKGVKVFAENNSQGRCYALGVLDEFEHLYDVDEVVITIHQPRLGHIDSETLTVDELYQWAKTTLAPAYALSLEPDAPRIPGEKQCQFCKAKGNYELCPDVEEYIQDGIRNGFPILDGDDAKLPPEVPLALASLAESWATAVKARALHMLEDGQPVVDSHTGDEHKLVAGKSSRIWKDEEKAKNKLRYRNFKVADYMTEPQFKSVAQVEKLVGKKVFLSDAAGFKDLVEKRAGKPSIAPMSDKRPAINSAEASGFEDLTEVGE